MAEDQKKIVIVLPGHSVERHADGSFKSTGLYQEAQFRAEGEAGPPYVRTGIYNRDLEGNSPTALLGGSRYVVETAAGIIHELLEHSEDYFPFSPEVEIVISAGRPAYLDKAAADQPDVSEGSVMEEELSSSGRTRARQVPVTVRSDGKTTKDDMEVVLEQAARDGVLRTLVIMMTFRIARCEAILAEMVLEKPELATLIDDKVVFVPAEMPDPLDFLEMYLSDAYARTMAGERFAIRKAVTGTTATTGGKT